MLLGGIQMPKYRPGTITPGGDNTSVPSTGNSPAHMNPEGYWKNQDTLANVPGQFGGMFRDMFGTNSDAGMRGYEAYVGGQGNLLDTYGSGMTQAGSDYMNNLGGTYGAYANAMGTLGQGSSSEMADMYNQYTTGYGSYNDALAEAMRGYTGAQNNYSNALGNVAGAMGNEGAARYQSIGDIAQGDFSALGGLSNAALANYGGISNAAMANAAANQQNYLQSLAILSNENQNALSDFGISQNQGLSNLGQGVANVGIEDIRSRDQALAGVGNAFANLGGSIEAERLRALTGLGQSAAALGGNLGQSYADVMSGAAPYLIDKDDSASSESTVNLGGLFDGFGGGGGSPTTVTAVGPNGEIINTSTVSGTGGGVSVGGGGSVDAGGTKTSESESSQSPNELMGGALGGAYGGIDSAGAAGFGQLGALQGLANNQDLGARAYGGIDSVMEEIRNREAANQAYSELDKIRLGIQDSEIPGMLNTNYNTALGTMGDAYNQSTLDNKSMLDTMRGDFINLANQGYSEIGNARDRAYDMVGRSGTDYSGILGDLASAYQDTRGDIDATRGDINAGFGGYTDRFDTAQDAMVNNDALALAGMGGLAGMLTSTQDRLRGGYGSQVRNFNDMFRTQGDRLDTRYQGTMDQQQANFEGQNELLQNLFDDSFGDNPFFMSGEERQAEADRRQRQAEDNYLDFKRRQHERTQAYREAQRRNAEISRKNRGPITHHETMTDSWGRQFVVPRYGANQRPIDPGYTPPVFPDYAPAAGGPMNRPIPVLKQG